MPFNDLREYIEALKKVGEVQVIDKEVDWNLEVGAISRRAIETSAPAPYFVNIKDYPGKAIFANPTCPGPRGMWRRFFTALEIDPDSSYQQAIEIVLDRLKNPIKPIMVSEGPCKEKIFVGDDVDIFSLPVPYIHGGDGGRYISTWHVVITKDPDSDWVNWGMYRQMIHTKNSLGGIIVPFSHIGMMYYGKYEERNIPMPFATVIGTEPVTAILGASSPEGGISEVDLIGAIRREPLSLVKCETNDLLVPATAEIVIEGEVLPHERQEEGPFGEYTGYRGSIPMPRPIYRVKAITYRNNPILTMSNMGVPMDDSGITCTFMFAAIVTDQFRKLKWPVKAVYVPPEMAFSCVVVSTKIPYANFYEKITGAIRNIPLGGWIPYIIVVEDDIDPANMQQVLFALATKCHPSRGIMINDKAAGHPLMPFATTYERKYSLGAVTTFNCTWPVDWDPKIDIPQRVKFSEIYPKEIQDRVLKRWKEDYGYEKDRYGGVWP